MGEGISKLWQCQIIVVHGLLQLAYIFGNPRNGVIDREELSQLLREGSSKLDPLTLVR